MKTKKDKRTIALLFLIPLLALVAVPFRTVAETAVKKKRTHALVEYTEKNFCGDSSEYCYIEEIHWLIDNGADVNAQMPNGEPIMRWSAKNGKLDIAQQLKKAGARPDVETQRIIWRAYQSNLNNQLLSAIDDNLIPSMQKLIAAGADVNFQDEYGDNPLAHAIDVQYLAGVKFLVAKGADVRAKYDGMSLLSFALKNGGEPQILSFLRKSGAPTKPTIDLFLAVIHNQPNEVRRRLQTGIDINTTNNGAKDGWTPLMWAASYGYVDMVRVLLKQGANSKIKDDKGRTALSCARNGIVAPKDKALLIKMLKEST